MNRIRKHYLSIPLLNFLFAAILGLFMRYAHVNSIPIPYRYRYITHAHSHIAILGWVYLAIFSLLVVYFIPEWYGRYKRLFWATQVSVIGMLFSFPFQGYAAASITFSSLHVIVSYFFIYYFLKDTKSLNSPSSKMLHASLLHMFISTIGLWCMAPIMAMKIKGGWDQVAIQFFLHFQFNGWFVFAIIALLFRKLKIKSTPNFKKFFVCLNLSLPLTFALPVSWYFKSPIWWWSNAVGIILQLVAVWYLLQIIKPKLREYWTNADKLKRVLIVFVSTSFFLKIILQSGALIPSLAASLVLHVNFVIGFIHLTMLGLISGFLLLFFLEFKNFIISRQLLRIGIYSFVFGVIATEAILFIQGLIFYLEGDMFPHYHLVLFIASVFLVLGIFTIGIQSLLPSRKSISLRE